MEVATKKWMITKSNDGCVVIVKSKKKTHPTDVFISSDTLKKNTGNGTFRKHSTLKYNDQPIYIHHQDL
tara:strand:- start:221 stop:427 length:207 start_codon:yes stop_codon:yes gene_type:complete